MVQGSEEKKPGTGVVLVGDPAGMKSLVARISEQIKVVAPRGISGEKLLKVAQVAASRNPVLYKCTEGSLMTALMTAGELGLDPSGTLGQGYLVPFYNSRLGAYEATFIPGYQGLISLAYRSGKLQAIHAAAVFEGDEWELELGSEPGLLHRPVRPKYGNQEARYAEMVGVYVTWTAGGCRSFHWLWKEEVEVIRQGSLTKQGKRAEFSPWTTHPVSMALKTAIRAAVKYMPLSTEDFTLFTIAEAHEDEGEARLVQGPAIDITPGDASFAPEDTGEEKPVAKDPKLV